METPIRFTREAFADITASQRTAILRLAENASTLEVMKDFSLPDGYVAFWQIATGHVSIYGGISPEGDVST